MNFPNEIAAGLTLQATVVSPDYLAPTWTLTAIIAGPELITLTATGSGDTHTFLAAATATAGWEPGLYTRSIRATDGTLVHEVASGQLRVLPDLAGVTAPYDGRSENEIALAAIDAVLGKRATIDQDRYRINNRELWRTPVADLLKLRAFYASKVRHEKNRQAGRSNMGRSVPVRFS